MPLLILVLVLAGLMLWRLWARDRAQAELGRHLDPLANRLFRRRRCRWRPEGPVRGSLRPFRCETCGVTAYSQNPKGPAECKRGLRSAL